MSTITYNIYRNDGSGGPIDYSTPIASTTATSWTSTGAPGLASPGAWKFGVRAFRAEDALEEKNLDAAVALILDASALDVSRRPVAPSGLRAIPRAAGAIRVEWGCQLRDRARAPIGFRIYAGDGARPDYTTPRASVAYALGRTSYFADLTGLASGTTYSLGVRAFNDAGEETNETAVLTTADAAGPAAVDTLTATATATQGD
jgi:hypothetical protein